MSHIVIFIFRRDLRIDDNLGYASAVEAATTDATTRLLPMFVFVPDQIKQNPLRNQHAISFMLTCLIDLRERLPSLRLFSGDHVPVLRHVRDTLRRRRGGSITHVVWNRDKTPYAKQRDEQIAAWCADNGIRVTQTEGDYGLMTHPIRDPPYRKFTPFYRRMSSVTVPKPIAVTATPRTYDGPRFGLQVSGSGLGSFGSPDPNRGGRTRALAILDRVRRGAFRTYGTKKVGPTTGLTPYLKFGCVSVREAYASFRSGSSDELMRQFMWREFFWQQGWLAVSSWDATQPPDPTPAAFRAWAEGRTPYAFLNDGMKQLTETGIMHNRMRMIAAKYLMDQGVDWRLGERHFAKYLVDYDPIQNRHGWLDMRSKPWSFNLETQSRLFR